MKYQIKVFIFFLASLVLLFSYPVNASEVKDCRSQLVGTYSVAPFTNPVGLAEYSRMLLQTPSLVPGEPVFNVTIDRDQAWITEMASGVRHQTTLMTLQPDERASSDEKMSVDCFYEIGEDALVGQVDLSKLNEKALEELLEKMTVFWTAYAKTVKERYPGVIFDLTKLKPRTFDVKSLRDVRYFFAYEYSIGSSMGSIKFFIPLEKITD